MTDPTSYCARVWTHDDEGAVNAARFATEAEAQAYGRNLSWRWSAVVRWEVQPTSDPVTCEADASGNLTWTDMPRADDEPKPAVPALLTEERK